MWWVKLPTSGSKWRLWASRSAGSCSSWSRNAYALLLLPRHPPLSFTLPLQAGSRETVIRRSAFPLLR
eukprot:113276-Prorocentrum_lima.AAC.1